MTVLPILDAASAARGAAPDVVEAGRVMATLDDWRAILFVALLIVVMQFIALVWVIGLSFRVTSKQIAANVDTAAALREMTSAQQSTAATLSRLESSVEFRR